MINVPKKPLFRALPYLGLLPFQSRTKLKKYLKGIMNYCKSQIEFQSQNKLANALRLKNRIPKELTCGVVDKFKCGLNNKSYLGQCVRNFNGRIGKEIGIWPLTRKIVKPKSSAFSDHLLLCNHSPSFTSLSVLTKENRIEKKSPNNER